VKHLGPPVAAVQDMVAVIARRGSRSSWHDAILRANAVSVNQKVECPHFSEVADTATSKSEPL
jgi:hypothetical protein